MGPAPSSTVGEIFRKGIALLQGAANPFIEAKILLMMAAEIGEVEFLGSPDRKISGAQEKKFFRLVGRRLEGRPLAYITGKKEFWSLPFKIVPGVLIPRPETELVVETVLGLPPAPGETLVDIGTGSGNIAVALGKELPLARIIAADVSAKALALAKYNARQNGVRNVVFKKGSLFLPLKELRLEGRCALIVSNPPYIPAADWETLPAEVREYEPKRALVGGNSGLEFVQKLVCGSVDFLKPGGPLIFEVGQGQAERALSFFDSRWKAAEALPDLQGIPRVIKALKA